MSVSHHLSNGVDTVPADLDLGVRCLSRPKHKAKARGLSDVLSEDVIDSPVVCAKMAERSILLDAHA